MRILLLSSSFNSLTQQAYVLFKAHHWVGVAAATTAETMRNAVAQFEPDLILCPMLAQVIPRDLWTRYPCFIVHPGIIGDRGPNSLDWAILNRELQWGVTVVQALGELGLLETQVNNDIIKALQAQKEKDEKIRPEVEEVIKKIQEKGKQSPPDSPSRSPTSSTSQ